MSVQSDKWIIKMAKDNAEMKVSEDFKLMLKGKVSKKYLN